ncbi:MAG: CpaF family protein [Oligoflexia bacterium]|nr:CpaF family protein [Oligoflexia bacterium]
MKFSQLEVVITEKSIEKFIQEVGTYNQKDCDRNSPLFDGTLPGGERINIVMDPVRREGPAITIRRFLKQIKTFSSQKGIFGLNERWVHLLKVLINARLNIIVSGGTGVGKTTFMNLMLQEVDKHDRVITIEDVREMNFNLPNIIRLETASIAGKVITMRDLVKNALRMRPDRIIVGEVRGAEVFDLLQAMNTGHEGCLASMHANNPGDCLSRLESLYLLSGYNVPIEALRQQIGSAIDFIIQLQRNRSGQRVVSHITELTDYCGGKVLSQSLGTIPAGLDYIVSSGLVPKCIERLKEHGLEEDLFMNPF